MKKALLLTTFLLLTVALVMSNVTFGDFSRSVFYNCEQYDKNSATCYPSKTSVTGRFTTGTSQRLYTPSSKEVGYSDGQYNNSLLPSSFLGEYVTIDNSKNFTFNTFTISFWVKRGGQQNSATILSFLNTHSTAGWIFNLINGTRAIFEVANGSGILTYPKSVPISSNQYYNLVGTFDGSTVSLYVDGKIYDKAQYSGQYHSPDLEIRIGSQAYNGGYSFYGTIDDLRIYDRALDANEISALYQNYSAHPSKNLVGHWTFDGNLADSSGNNNDASLRTAVVSMVFAPDGRMFFSEKRTGVIRIMSNDRVISSPFATITGLHHGDHQGLLGITLDPKYDTNHYVYAYITYREEKSHKPFNAVLRLTDVHNHGENATAILSGIPADINGNYAGGALAFGPDEKLYVTVGMGPRPSDVQVKSSVLGKVLRINRDGTIPKDNPFPNSPVYTLGHRNMFGLAFDKNGQGFVTENGDTHFDELNMLEKGQNYGFPNSQYPTLTSIKDSRFILPIREYDKTIAPAQAIFYSGNKYPEISNSFIFASYNHGNIHSLKISKKNNQTFVDDLVIDFKRDFPENIVSVAQSPTGDLYYGGYNIYKVQSISSESKTQVFPITTNLSDGVDIEDMRLSIPNKSLMLHTVYAQTHGSDNKGVMDLEIPEGLLNDIFSVSAKDYSTHQKYNKSAIESSYTQQRGLRSTFVQIDFNKNVDSLISINGTGTDALGLEN